MGFSRHDISSEVDQLVYHFWGRLFYSTISIW